jgi:hypothetical protein
LGEEMSVETYHWRYGIETEKNGVHGSGRFLCVYCSEDLSVEPEFTNDEQEGLYCDRCFAKIVCRPKG